MFVGDGIFFFQISPEKKSDFFLRANAQLPSSQFWVPQSIVCHLSWHYQFFPGGIFHKSYLDAHIFIWTFLKQAGMALVFTY